VLVVKRLWGRETRRGERNLIGKVVSSGDGCLCAVKVEVDGNQSRLKWRERERMEGIKGVIHVRLCVWLVDIFL
jgi:hypothetical protein